MGRPLGNLLAVDLVRILAATFLFTAWIISRQAGPAVAHAVALSLSFSHLGYNISALVVPHAIVIIGQWGALLAVRLADTDAEAYVWTGTAWAYCLALAGARVYGRKRHGVDDHSVDDARGRRQKGILGL
jgi:hypothetical protein